MTDIYLAPEPTARGFEFWAIIPDYAAFAERSPTCAKKLEELCALRACQVKIFLGSTHGYREMHALEAKYQAHYTEIIMCEPFGDEFSGRTILRRTASNNEYDYFEATDLGFRRLDPSEWVPFERSLPNMFVLRADDEAIG